MNSQETSTILAIDPGTRYVGIAVLDDKDLIYQGVKTLPRRQSPDDGLSQVQAFTLRLINDFRPGLLVIERAFMVRSRTAGLLNVTVDEMRAIGVRHGLTVRILAPSTVRKRLCGNGRATKRDVARAVADRYPELKVYLGQNRKWKERFHGNMFDAIALALVGSP
ncbi:crossover junction endodeoxyribonuclease RuvC [Candidatus Berkelbacteria bacterium]|nr:crossover junction endodeoxyribonuclease RuvC [Candidatus Berkelbacteria bacterium]